MLGKLKAIGAAILVALLAVLGAFFRGRSKGADDQKQRQAAEVKRASDEAQQVKNEVQNEIAKSGGGQSADKLRNDWMRDD